MSTLVIANLGDGRLAVARLEDIHRGVAKVAAWFESSQRPIIASLAAAGHNDLIDGKFTGREPRIKALLRDNPDVLAVFGSEAVGSIADEFRREPIFFGSRPR